MGATTALISMGTVEAKEPETKIVFDTPAGIVESRARIAGHRVVDVSIANVPSFLHTRDLAIELPDIGPVTVDVSYGGNFFALVSAEKLGVGVDLSNYAKLVSFGMAIKDAVNRRLQIQHPTKPHINQVALTEIYEKPSTLFSKSVVIFGQGQVNRCPCGTGTSAAMAMMYSKGELPLGAKFLNESIIGTRFEGVLTREARVGDFAAVEPIITGRSYITGIQQIVVDPCDSLKYGFMIAP